MLTLLKNLECYTPQYIGKRDIIIAFDKIYKIEKSFDNTKCMMIDETIDCEGLIAFPGLIDQHVHIIGGGGESGFASRVTEIDFNEIINAGITTVVGVLGLDRYTRSLRSLLGKAKALDELGITSFIYTGSYEVPTVTLTDDIASDIVFIDKVIGVGEVAISDDRSSYPSTQDLLKLASQAHIGGLISGKAGVVHLHVGDGKQELEPLLKLATSSDFPYETFVPTHVNRNEHLFSQALEYCRLGGYIDLTAGETVGVPVPAALKILNEQGVDTSRVTVSSDGNCSGISNVLTKIKTLYDDIRICILNEGFSIENALSYVTENVAGVLKLYPRKGALRVNSDADIVIANRNLEIKKLYSCGKLLIDNQD